MTPRLESGARVHLVGVGGAGMSALAQLLLERGHPVSGSDLCDGPVCDALAAIGATVHIGHDAAHVDGADLVVWSSAVPPSNPERIRAADLGVPQLGRADLLELLMASSRRVLVAGTHGKTTTTSMVAVILQAAGLDPSFAIGGALQDGGVSARHGSGPFVAEADEAYRSFLRLTPDCAVVTNVEMDHHDEYADLDAVTEAFRAFLARRPRGGLAIACADNPGASALLDDAAEPTLRYGERPDSALRITDVALPPDGGAFRLRQDGEDLGEFRLRLPGRHNVRNAAAAVAVARWVGADLEAARAALAGFRGACRRFQRVGEVGDVAIVDDYGHHPTELEATIAAARQSEPGGRIIAVFQPHRHSRTAALGTALGTALAGADVVLVTDVYAAGEEPLAGSDARVVAEAVAAGGTEVHLVRALRDVPGAVAALVRPGDLVLTLGAGSVTQVGPVVLELLRERRQAHRRSRSTGGPRA